MRLLPSCVLGLLAAAVALTPCASAAPDPLGSGTTQLRFEKSFLTFCKRDGVKLSAVTPATLKGGVLTLPVSGGLIDPTTGKGRIEQQGALVFSSGHRRLPFKFLRVQTKREPLIAKVGGSQLKLATAKKISFAREGFGSAFSAAKLAISAKAVTRLNKKLRPKIRFKAGQAFASTVSKTEPSTTAILEAGRATLVFDPGFVTKLEALNPKVALNPIFPAEHQGPTFTFPIIPNGAISPDASVGTLRTGGEVEFLQLGGGQVFWREPWLELGPKQYSVEANIEPSPPLAGKVGRIGVGGLGAYAASQDPAARTITISNAPLTLDAQTAKTFDEAFAGGAEYFKAGEALGAFSFTAQGQ